jgi:hypothetical protein
MTAKGIPWWPNTKTDMARAYDLYKRGQTMSELALIFNVTTRTICRWIAKQRKTETTPTNTWWEGPEPT